MNRDITSPVYDFLFQKENKKIQEAKRKCEKQLYSKIQKEEAQKQKKFKKFQEQKSFINLLSKISPLKEDKNPKWVVNVHKTKEFICRVCDIKFEGKADLKLHSKLVH